MLKLVIFVNVAVYAAMAATTGQFSWSARQLLDWGGDLGVLSLHGQYWRLLTGTYLHASPMHLIGNMVLLAITGTYVEAKIGPTRSFAAYTACGLAASLLSAYGHPNIVGVGASGAIAGLLGIMVTLYLIGRHNDISGQWIAQTIGINALYSLVPSVDWVAHLGGFVAGLACGAILLATAPPDRITNP